MYFCHYHLDSPVSETFLSLKSPTHPDFISSFCDSLNLISFLLECGCKVVYWHMGNLSVAIPLKKMTPPPSTITTLSFYFSV